MSGRVKTVGCVVLHADDFGMNAAVNAGILAAFRRGLLTSTSLLANAPSAETACQSWPQLAAEHACDTLPSTDLRSDLGDSQLPFDLGIHLNLTQGRPLTSGRYPAELLDQQGRFPGIGHLFSRLLRLKSASLELVAAELRAQIEWMCDRGFRPSHLNGHQYVELIPCIAAKIPELLQRYSIPVVRVACEPGLVQNVLCEGSVTACALGVVKRHFGLSFRRRMKSSQAAFPDRFFGTSHAGRIGQSVMQKFIRKPFTAGFSEIGLHPGCDPENNTGCDPNVNGDDDTWLDPLANLRPAECEWLCHPGLVELLKNRGVELGRLRSLRTAT